MEKGNRETSCIGLIVTEVRRETLARAGGGDKGFAAHFFRWYPFPKMAFSKMLTISMKPIPIRVF